MTQSIIVEGLSKQYRIGEQREDLLQERLVSWVKHSFGKNTLKTPETIWALKDVSFKVEAGEVLGLIGRNGAGKSTLLKILSRITYPTSGTLKVNGRIAALLEVGTGFHGDLTGRENIFLNGSILGMAKKMIEAKLDAIVAFAGVERFIDTPVKHYSSGMFLRLGFAVAAHLDQDVLLVDEVLAVGDAAFQKKCLNAMDEMRSGGRTVLFVSHNMAAVENLCSRALWIDDGQIKLDGKAKDVVASYMSANADSSCLAMDLTTARNRQGNGSIRFTKAEFLTQDGEALRFIKSGLPLMLRLHYTAQTGITRPDFEVGVFTDLGTLVTKFSTWVEHQIPKIPPGKGCIDLLIDSFNFLPGRYYLSLHAKTTVGTAPIHHDRLDHCIQFEIEASDCYCSGRGMFRYFGLVFFPCKWRLHGSTPVESEECRESSEVVLPDF